MCFLSLRERHVSSQFDDFSQRIHLAFTNVHLLIASRSPCSLCALILPRQTPFHFHSARLTMLEKRKAMICDDSVLAALVKILTSHQNQAVCGPQQALHLFVRSAGR